MDNLKDEFLEKMSRYQGILHKVCLVYFRDPEEREDNFQEILYQLWKSFPQLKANTSIGSWIYAVSINTSLSRLRKKRKMEYREVLPEMDQSDDVIEKMHLDEDIQLLMHAIYNLKEIDKSIMLLVLEERGYDEIAEILGLSKSNVGVRISRAKEMLKQNLNNLNYGKQ